MKGWGASQPPQALLGGVKQPCQAQEMKLLALILLLGALGGRQALATAAPSPSAKPFKVEEATDFYTFGFAWPAEASAVPQLVKRFRTQMADAKLELEASASADRKEREAAGYDFLNYHLQYAYETAGQSTRLLSLGSSVYSFTGGAHGSNGSGALLWDRQLGREIKIADLLKRGASWTAAIRQPFCVLLDRERQERRGEPTAQDQMFGNCPEYRELTVLLQDDDRNSQFDHVLVTADQYVAGPYAEGPYEISLPITATMIERIKPEYRSSFEARPGVK